MKKYSYFLTKNPQKKRISHDKVDVLVLDVESVSTLYIAFNKSHF